MSGYPRVYVQRHSMHRRGQRYCYKWNRHRYSVETLRLVCSHQFASTLPGAFLKAYLIPVGEACDRLHSWIFRDREWWA